MNPSSSQSLSLKVMAVHIIPLTIDQNGKEQGYSITGWGWLYCILLLFVTSSAHNKEWAEKNQ
tara:strand:+ start:86 stop:274 length:189 start_codon:yes stop_codon:yes gene_type:complete